MIPSMDRSELVEEELHARWDIFFDRYVPASKEAKEFTVACLNEIVATYEKQIETVLDFIDELPEEE